MTEQRDPYAWIADPAERGSWLLERFAGSGAERVGLRDWVPGGFEAYVRVLHPFSRDRPETGAWAEFEALLDSDRWEEAPNTIDEDRIPWRDVAAAFGRDLHATSRSEQLLGTPWGEGDAIAPDGWRYSAPDEGSLDTATLAGVVAILNRFTETPERGAAAVWEGFGGLTSAQGVGYLFAFEPPARMPRWMVAPWSRVMQRIASFSMRREHFGRRAALHDLLLPHVQQPAGTGLLPREVAKGPRLELPDGTRDYICFEVDLGDFADGSWPHRAPWVDRRADFGGADFAGSDFAGSDFADDEMAGGQSQSPQLLWPEGREWVLATEIDFDSTIIACSRECADALLAAGGGAGPSAGTGFEAFEISRDTEELWHDVDPD